jgi:transcriptional regulator with XRE-family HTH domain
MTDNLGQKIKKYRTRAGMSQMDLGLAIDASAGSVSRIEGGKVNPSKETLSRIARELCYNAYEIAHLYGITGDVAFQTLQIINSFTRHIDANDAMQCVVDEIADRLNYVSVAMFLFRDNRLYGGYLNQNMYSKLAQQAMGGNLAGFSVSDEEDPNNLLLQSVKQNKPLVSKNMYEFGRGVLRKQTLSFITKLTSMKSAVALPIIGDEPIGAMYIARSNQRDYSIDIPYLEALSVQIGIHLTNIGVLTR